MSKNLECYKFSIKYITDSDATIVMPTVKELEDACVRFFKAVNCLGLYQKLPATVKFAMQTALTKGL